MRRTTFSLGLFLLPVALLGLAVWASAQFSGPVNPRAVEPVQTVFQVIASDAPGWMRKGGPGVYLCDGVRDEVELQAASDAAAAVGGGTVRPSMGLFSLSKPTGAVDVVFTADLTDGSAQATLGNFGAFTAGAATDLAVGQLYRCSGGLNDGGGGISLEDRKSDIIVTILTVTGSPPTSVTVSEDFRDLNYTVGGGGAKPTFARIIGCVQLKPNVHIRGAGIDATRMKLANNQNCTMFTSEPSTTVYGVGLHGMDLIGNRENQGDGDGTSPYTFHPLCNGIVLNSFTWDSHFSEIAVGYCDGDNWWIDEPWGFQIYGGWSEFSSGSGMAFGDGSMACLSHVKIAGVVEATDRDAHASNTLPGDGAVFTAAGLRLYFSGYCRVTGCYVSSERQWSIYALNAFQNQFTGSHVYHKTTGSGGIWLDVGSNNTITGCTLFAQTGATTPTLRDGGFYGQSVTGNTFGNTPIYPIDVATLNFRGNYSNNHYAFLSDLTHASGAVSRVPAEVRTDHCLNDSGVDIAAQRFVRRPTAAGVAIVAASTTSKDVFGFATHAIANTVAGTVEVHGYNPRVGIDDTLARAIAVGDRLCCSNETAGLLEEAATGDWVVAIALHAYSAAGGGTVVYRAAYILPPGERYTAP